MGLYCTRGISSKNRAAEVAFSTTSSRASIKTDVVELPFLDNVCYAEQLPYPDRSVGALAIVNVCIT